MEIACPVVVLGIAAAIAAKPDAIDTNSKGRNRTFITTDSINSTGTSMTTNTDESLSGVGSGPT
jgi:hypothetical protein